MAKLIIEAGRAEKHYWLDLWRYRELFFILAWRDVAVRYKQTFIGFVWALVRPLLTMIIFSVIFGRIAQLPSAGVPYPLFVFAAMLPWQLFANALTEASGSLVANERLITKVYFPRMIVPASSVIVSVVDFLVSFLILVGMFVYYQHAPTWRLLALPALLLLAFLTALGPGLLITALNVQYRDFRYVIPFIVQFGLYVSPVGFSTSMIPEQWRLLYALNPMVGVIDGFRWAICGTGLLNWESIAVSVAVTVVLLWFGVWYFRRMERSFADVI
jgi:lipopolysaccharide transport system permease protein